MTAPQQLPAKTLFDLSLDSYIDCVKKGHFNKMDPLPSELQSKVLTRITAQFLMLESVCNYKLKGKSYRPLASDGFKGSPFTQAKEISANFNNSMKDSSVDFTIKLQITLKLIDQMALFTDEIDFKQNLTATKTL